ncbi:hypothetical protein KIN20_032826 [Parelaphostrongylus tenuis]|uniref:ZP domain-containing protein n=1 Tax=Parelaphostrongylus tenuis TaxID=148309 RepID=A0AAD5WHY2_PARTN|nr:hypothetical protein KIN20_032826 [Parelaphostrongylus tenuis]
MDLLVFKFRFQGVSCYVRGGKRDSYLIINENGCSVDEAVLPHPTYDMTNGVVYASTMAFRFTKSRRVSFSCMISVCHKDDYCMNDIPPSCPRSLRKRQLREEFFVDERLKHSNSETKSATHINDTVLVQRDVKTSNG